LLIQRLSAAVEGFDSNAIRFYLIAGRLLRWHRWPSRVPLARKTRTMLVMSWEKEQKNIRTMALWFAIMLGGTIAVSLTGMLLWWFVRANP
jgi:hypothetical protein